jgi:signal transduction histidine kinase
VYVEAPEAVLAVALGNLIGNACKYTQEGDVRIVVEAGAVLIEDSGPGLSEEDAAKLFERGYRGSGAGGTSGGGIGLSIVRRLCELYGWNVSIRPGAERGAIARLTFPHYQVKLGSE